MRGDVYWQRNNWMYICLDSKEKGIIYRQKEIKRWHKKEGTSYRKSMKAVHPPFYVTRSLFFEKFFLLDSAFQTFGTETTIISSRSITFLQTTFLSPPLSAYNFRWFLFLH